MAEDSKKEVQDLLAGIAEIFRMQKKYLGHYAPIFLPGPDYRSEDAKGAMR